MKTLRCITTLLCSSFLLVSAASHAQAKPQAAIQGTFKTIYDMLKEMPGLEIKSNNGRGNSIIVRGLAKLAGSGSSEPLFVVDGTIYSGDINNLNPSDIDGITVLKDAASTTAYGAQGANGVIVVTTKKGTVIKNSATVSAHNESAYTYFIDRKTPLKVYGNDDKVIIEGVIEKQRGDTLVFIKKRKDFLVPISSIKRVEMVPQQ